MKRHGNLWDKIIDPDNLYLAYRRARKGKGWTRSVAEFEKDVEGNLKKLHELLVSKKFNTSKYSTKEIYEPKHRTLYKLPFYPDRIVQHALLQVVIPIWDSLMIEDSYACRPNKGMHIASKKTVGYVKKYKYCMKADISKFYPSIDHDVLFNIIKEKIKCSETLNLLHNIIYSFPGGKNAPIGNYTSQWFGNIYLNKLDQEIKHKHKGKAYIRYCDDFVLFSDDKEWLKSILSWVKEYAGDVLKLKLSKGSVFPVTQGVDFLGYRHFPNKILLRKTTAKRVKKRMKELPDLLNTGKISLDQYRSSIASTEGWMKWANTHNFKTHLNIHKLKEVLL